MIDVLALQFTIPLSPFGATSRYAGLEVARITVHGETFAYVRRRFVPLPENLAVVGEHAAVQRERLDHIASRFIGDPELFWRVADGNRAMRPEELTETLGRRLLITLPEGVAGIPNA